MVKVDCQVSYCRKILVTYIDPDILLDGLREEMRAICNFSPDQEFTMKWIDEEGTVWTLFLHTKMWHVLILNSHALF